MSYFSTVCTASSGEKSAFSNFDHFDESDYDDDEIDPAKRTHDFDISLKDDYDYVEKKVKERSRYLKCASKRLRNEPKICLAAESLKYAGEIPRMIRGLVMKLVEISISNFQYADISLKKDKEFVKEVIQVDIMALRWVDASLMGDPNFAIEVIFDSHGEIIEYETGSIINDAFHLFLPPVKNDRNFVYRLVVANGEIPRGWNGDEKLMTMLVKKNPEYSLKSSKKLRRSRRFVKEAAKNARFNFFDVFPDFKDDKEIAMIAVENNGLSLRKVSEKLKDDIDIVRAAVGQNPKAIKCASERAAKEFRTMVL